ncbi:MAG: enoyl-CoA hydratase/isomerase family protein [Planctomycetes bacterium]|nr:enoyl-CoA hydratase/isomerase family protein [Planctomycetota bacterium]
MAFLQSKHLWVQQLGDGVAVFILDRQQSPTNYLDLVLLDEIDQALDAIAAAKAFRIIVIRSGKSGNFCHGPSPSLLSSWTKEDFLTWSERGQKLCCKLADLPIPSACLIAGSCLDAGLELALACDYRVLVDDEATSVGFPELNWGMIPCFGGSQRLPRLIGLENSLQLLLFGKRLEAREAWICGLGNEMTEASGDIPPGFLESPRKHDWTEFPGNTWRQRWLESNRLGRWFLFRGADRILRTGLPDELPAPAVMLEAIRHVYSVADVNAGLQVERQAIEQIAQHPALHHMLRLLLHRDRLRAPSIGTADKSQVRWVGVVGGGVAALALYMHCIAQGYQVVLRAADREALAMGMLQIGQLLDVEVERGTLDKAQLAQLLGAFRGTYTWTHFEKLYLILDTTGGTLTEKQQFYQEMERHIPAGATIVPISPLHRVEDLQKGLRHPERLLGLNLLEPGRRGSLAEIIATPQAAQPQVQRVREWLLALGKYCVQVPDRIGGLVLRIWLPALNEAGILVKEGVPVDQIDQAMRRFGMTLGPLEWMDQLGIDQVASLVAALQPAFDGRIQLETGFALMAQKQWLGVMTEVGFYQPGFSSPKPHWPAVELWKSQSQGEEVRPTPALTEADMHLWIQNRLVTLMILEAVHCLVDGLAKDPDDLDCAMCLTGWAMHRGGPLGYGRQLGLDTLTSRCLELVSSHGRRFAPITALADFLS